MRRYAVEFIGTVYKYLRAGGGGPIDAEQLFPCRHPRSDRLDSKEHPETRWFTLAALAFGAEHGLLYSCHAQSCDW